jgi:RNA polymerase sigma-70 factor, ECF subfamily
MPAHQVMSAADARRDAVLGLFLQHQSMLGGFLHGLSADRELTEAALQDCAVFVCARWHRFTPGADFGAWVRTIARQRLREAVRRRGRLGDVDDLGEELGDGDWAACEGRDAERKDALAGCLRELPGRDRELIELRYLHHLRVAVIAARLGHDADELSVSLCRLRRRLRIGVDQRLEATAATAADGDLLVERRLDHGLGPTERETLRGLLRGDAGLRRRFADALAQDHALRVVVAIAAGQTSSAARRAARRRVPVAAPSRALVGRRRGGGAGGAGRGGLGVPPQPLAGAAGGRGCERTAAAVRTASLAMSG